MPSEHDTLLEPTRVKPLSHTAVQCSSCLRGEEQAEPGAMSATEIAPQFFLQENSPTRLPAMQISVKSPKTVCPLPQAALHVAPCANSLMHAPTAAPPPLACPMHAFGVQLNVEGISSPALHEITVWSGVYPEMQAGAQARA